MKYYKLDSSMLEKELDTDLENGLTSYQVSERFRECGYNTRYSKPSFSVKSINLPLLLIEILIPVVYLLFALFNLKSALVYISYAVASLVIVFLSNILFLIIGFLYDRGVYLSALNDPHTLSVIRDGKNIRVKYTELSYGDVVLLSKGDYIPFDGVLLSSNGLVTDETGIGGDDRVSKHIGVISEDNLSPSQLFNTVFCGTYVVHGKAKAVVTDVASRVYLVKSGRKKINKKDSLSKNVDIFTIFSAIFSLFCIIFSVVCGLISNDFSGIVTSVLLFSAIIVSGFMRMFSEIIYKKSFISLVSKNIAFKSFYDIELLNNSDVVLVNYNMFFDDKAEISAFISENMEFTPVSAIGKNNFSTFLYAAFCLDSDNSVLNPCIKILKKIGVDFSEINTMCPVFSRSEKKGGVELCARAYDGNNMIIAAGDINVISNMCDCTVPDNVLGKLNCNAIEMIGVAIKNISIIPNDLSSQVDGFTFVGVIGVNRRISSDISLKCQALSKNGVHPIILFPGNESSLRSTVGNNANIVSLAEIESLNRKNYSDVGFICDYDGNYGYIVSLLSKAGYLPSYFGDKTLRDRKCVAFKSVGLTSYDTKDADVIIPEKFDSVYTAFENAKSAAYRVNSVFECFCLFAAFYVICGVLFSLLFNDLMITTVSAAFVLLLVLPFAFFVSIYGGGTIDGILRKGISKDSNDKNFSFVIVTSGIFLLICVATKFLCTAQVSSPFLLLTFITYLCAYVDKLIKKPHLFALSLLLPTLFALLLMSPASYVFGYSMLGVLPAVISLVTGGLVKILSKFICRSVKI